MIPFDSVRIVGKTYRIEEVPNSPLANNYNGIHDANRGLIQVQDDLCEGQIRDTLLHECLHGIDYAMALDLSERQVHAMAAGMLALLKDNPGLAGWLAAEEGQCTSARSADTKSCAKTR